MTESTTDPYKSTEWSMGSLGLLFLLMGVGSYRNAADTRLPLLLMVGGALVAIVSARSFWQRTRRSR